MDYINAPVNIKSFYDDLLFATECNDFELVTYLITSILKIINSQQERYVFKVSINYSFLKACEVGNLNLISLFLFHGADINEFGNLAIKISCINGSLDNIKYLLQEGAKFGEDDNWDMKYAIMGGHTEIVEYIIKKKYYHVNDILLFINLASQCLQHKIVLYFIRKYKFNVDNFMKIYPEFNNYISNIIEEQRQINKNKNKK